VIKVAKYGNYDYVQADIDLYNIPEKYHAIMRNIFSKNEAATFKYDKDSDTCCYTNWPDMKPWYDVLTGNVISGFGDVGMFPTLLDEDVYGTINTKKVDKIQDPVEEHYQKIIPKKPMELLVSQKA
jgi:hypothetical protein